MFQLLYNSVSDDVVFFLFITQFSYNFFFSVCLFYFNFFFFSQSENVFWFASYALHTTTTSYTIGKLKNVLVSCCGVVVVVVVADIAAPAVIFSSIFSLIPLYSVTKKKKKKKMHLKSFVINENYFSV